MLAVVRDQIIFCAMENLHRCYAVAKLAMDVCETIDDKPIGAPFTDSAIQTDSGLPKRINGRVLASIGSALPDVKLLEPGFDGASLLATARTSLIEGLHIAGG